MKKLRLVLFLSLCVLEAKFSYAQTDKLDSLFNIGMNLLQSGKYDEAARIYEECLTFPEVRSTKTEAVLLDELGVCKLALGYSATATDFFLESLGVWSNVADENDDNDLEYGMRITSRLIYSFLAQADSCEAKGNQETADSIRRATLDGYALIEEIIGDYPLKGKYREAIYYAELKLHLLSKIKQTNKFDIINVLDKLSSYHYHIGEINKSIEYGELALKLSEDFYGKYSVYNIILMSDLAGRLYAMGMYSEGLKLKEQTLKYCESSPALNTIYHFIILNELATFNSGMGNYSEALDNYEQADEILMKIQNGKRREYTCCSGIDSLFLYEKQGTLIEKYTNRNSYEYSQLLENRAFHMHNIGNDSTAIRIGKEIKNIRKGLFGEESESYANSLTNLATFYFSLGNYFEAAKLSNQTIDIRKKKQNRLLYARELNNLAVYKGMLGNYDDAQIICERSIDILDSVAEKHSVDYAITISTLAGCLLEKSDYSEALRIAKQSLDILENVTNKKSDIYIETLDFVADCLFHMVRKDDLTHYSDSMTNLLDDILLENFKSLTIFERELFWNKYNKWYTEKLNKYAFSFPTDTLCMTAYNGALLSKGLLLNSEIEMRKLLQESGDAVVDSLYEEMRINKLMLQRLYEKPKNERYLSTDSIEKIVDILEKQLLKRSKVYGDYTKNLRIDYKDVRGKLKDGDLAVEFCSFPLSKDSTMYMALVLRNDMEYPKMVPLFEEKQISKLRKDIYKGGYTATLVWKPLEQYLNKAKNVYFGPSGELYNIAIENIPHWSENCLMSDKWNIYRLSSTRELAVIRDKDAVRKASVYGGIVYDTGTDVLTADTVRYGRQRSVFYGLYNLSDSLSVRGGVEYLPATKEEAEYVDDALKGRHIASTLRTDMQATEGAFKDMAGKRNNLLHIATHAFYWPEKEVVTADRDFMFMSNMPQRYKEDKAMTRSGLVLAGANNALRGMKLPEDVNDGILTAKEIAQLDLRGLDLVVLSACQTGLGEVTGDGVFGLQRGFKKAGANSLMMSLWSVDDEATSLFMKEFYRQLMAGNGKHDSMKAAQRHVREYKETDEDGEVTHPYDNYKYWAAFVLLDAIR
jgi:hypothetical protein